MADAAPDPGTETARYLRHVSNSDMAMLSRSHPPSVASAFSGRFRDAVDTIAGHAINVTTSDNYRIGSDLALRMAEDMLGEGKVLVFNGFYTVPVCKIRYDQLRYVMEAFSRIELIEPELIDVIPDTVRHHTVSQFLCAAAYGLPECRAIVHGRELQWCGDRRCPSPFGSWPAAALMGWTRYSPQSRIGSKPMPGRGRHRCTRVLSPSVNSFQHVATAWADGRTEEMFGRTGRTLPGRRMHRPCDW